MENVNLSNGMGSATKAEDLTDREVETALLYCDDDLLNAVNNANCFDNDRELLTAYLKVAAGDVVIG